MRTNEIQLVHEGALRRLGMGSGSWITFFLTSIVMKVLTMENYFGKKKWCQLVMRWYSRECNTGQWRSGIAALMVIICSGKYSVAVLSQDLCEHLSHKENWMDLVFFHNTWIIIMFIHKNMSGFWLPMSDLAKCWLRNDIHQCKQELNAKWKWVSSVPSIRRT